MLSNHDCIRRLQEYLDDIEVLLDLLKGNLNNRENVIKIQGLFKSLRSRLESDYKSRDTKRGRENMSDVEKAFFAHTVHQAYADISIKSNSRPNEKWFSELYKMRITIQFSLDGLKSTI